MPLSPLGGGRGGGGGGTGFALGIAPNLFADGAYASTSVAGRSASPAANLAAAVALRDTQSNGSTAGKVAWLATYDNDSTLNIRLMYMDSGNAVVQYQIRSGGAWATNSSVVGVRGASGAPVEFGSIPAQHLPAVSADGTPVDSNVEVKADGVYYDDRKLAEVTDIPTPFSGDYDDLTDKPDLFDGRFAELKGVPSFQTRPEVLTIADQAAADAVAGRATPADVDIAIRNAVGGGAQDGIVVSYDAARKVFNFTVSSEPPQPGDVHDVYYATFVSTPPGTSLEDQEAFNVKFVTDNLDVENISGVRRVDALAGTYRFTVVPGAKASDRLAIAFWVPPAAGDITSLTTNSFNILNTVKKVPVSAQLSGDTVSYNAWVGTGSLDQAGFPYTVVVNGG